MSEAGLRPNDPIRHSPLSGTSPQLVPGFTGSLTVRYRRPTPLERDLQLRAWVDRVDGRKSWVVGTCHLDGKLVCEAEGLFISPGEGASLDGILASITRKTQQPPT